MIVTILMGLFALVLIAVVVRLAVKAWHRAEIEDQLDEYIEENENRNE